MMDHHQRRTSSEKGLLLLHWTININSRLLVIHSGLTFDLNDDLNWTKTLTRIFVTTSKYNFFKWRLLRFHKHMNEFRNLKLFAYKIYFSLEFFLDTEIVNEFNFWFNEFHKGYKFLLGLAAFWPNNRN